MKVVDLNSNCERNKKIVSRNPNTFATIWKCFRETSLDYFKGASIHGFPHTVDENSFWIERIFWFAVIIISMLICGFITIQIWLRWDYSPTIISIAESSTPIFEIPFPTITICPIDKSERKQFYYKDAFLEYNEYPGNNNKELEILEAMFQICSIPPGYNDDFDLHESYTNDTMIDILKDFAPQVGKFLQWKGKTISEDILKPILTDDGVCYSFNALEDKYIYRNHINKESENKLNWTLQNGYDKNYGSTHTYPKRVISNDAEETLKIFLSTELQNWDSYCVGRSQGYKLSIHTPGDVPNTSKEFYRIPFKKMSQIAIKPDVIATSSALRSYNPIKRQCFFEDERYLRYFISYSQANCEHECVTNLTLEQCGCVKFTMPREPGVPLCGVGKINCYHNARENSLQHNYLIRKCLCLPTCTSISYNAEVTQSKLSYKFILELFGKEEYEEQKKIYGLTKVTIYFEDNQFVSSKRSELYDWPSFIANIGGLFGLFMGVSMLGLVEIFYYFTIRVCFNIRKQYTEKRN